MPILISMVNVTINLEMQMNHYFKAVHSTGRVHTRATSGMAYAWACVGARLNSATFHARQDLAVAEQRRRLQRDETLEVVPAVEIPKAEHAATVKAGKAAFKVTYMGKTYTKTCSVESTRPYVCAIGYDQPYTSRFVPGLVAQERIDYLSKWPDCAATLKRALEQNERGGYTQEYRAQRGVFWFNDRAEAEKYLASRLADQQKPDAVPTTYEMLELA